MKQAKQARGTDPRTIDARGLAAASGGATQPQPWRAFGPQPQPWISPEPQPWLSPDPQPW